MSSGSDLLLEMRGITKSFGAVTVLDRVSLSLRSGEVLGLVGENGAGKSTLIKILTGLYTLDSGSIQLDGEPVSITRPADAEARGIRVIHQDRHQAGRLTVAEQLYLGSEVLGSSWRRVREEQQRATADILRCTGQKIDGAAFVEELSVSQQQLIQITRAVLTGPRILILDEPTAPLAAEEVRQLFGTIAHLRETGVGIIFISHYLQELREITDRITVLRNGQNAGDACFNTGDTIDDVVQLMVGSAVSEFESGRQPRRWLSEEPALVLKNVGIPGQLSNINLEVHPGEIVGVTGLVGSGIESLADAATSRTKAHGTICLWGQRIRSMADFVSRGGGYVPADRRDDGIFIRNTVRENIAAASLKTLGRRLGFTALSREREQARALIRKLDVRPADPEAVASQLSGGNQQKVVLGKWLAHGARVLVLDQPTAGVDVGSRAEIYRQINELVDQGAAVLVVTVDLEELVGIADRIAVLYRGQLLGQLPGASTTTDQVLRLASAGDTSLDSQEQVNA